MACYHKRLLIACSSAPFVRLALSPSPTRTPKCAHTITGYFRCSHNANLSPNALACLRVEGVGSPSLCTLPTLGHFELVLPQRGRAWYARPVIMLALLDEAPAWTAAVSGRAEIWPPVEQHGDTHARLQSSSVGNAGNPPEELLHQQQLLACAACMQCMCYSQARATELDQQYKHVIAD